MKKKTRTKPRVHWIVWPVLVLALAGLILPLVWPAAPAGAQGTSTGAPAEQPVIPIPLSGLAADDSAELSGLAWYGDYLILLPQYPRHSTGGNEGYIYALPKSQIVNYLDGKMVGPLEPLIIPFDAYGLRDQMHNFQGFESIGFSGDRVYATIEAGGVDGMMGYLVSGQVMPGLSRIVMDTDHLQPITPQVEMYNKADEALLVLDDRVITFFEVNGAAFNPKPVVHVFDLDLKPLDNLPMASLEYRLTDAARIPGTDQFWVIDSFFLVDFQLLPKSDPLAKAFGKGPTHSRFPMVERLVKLKYDASSGVSLTNDPPVQLQLHSFETRNWEGLALLDQRGFLLATDKYPSTILAFVPLP